MYQFADEDNAKITHLDDFADRFLAKCALGRTISKYMVLIATERQLLMMRPHQIYAVKAIVDCIDQNCGNGYVWHTTGSGKTLTSFKASTLLKTDESTHKRLFVVDRKDLDRQTREEFNRFQENCVEENTNTATLVRRLESDDYADKVIVTTIQQPVAKVPRHGPYRLAEYVHSLKEGEGLDEAEVRTGYERFKAEKQAKEIDDLARTHGLTTESLSAFADTILQRMIFDGEQLTDLMEPLSLGWRERRERELALMADLVPLLKKRAEGREISGLIVYEQQAEERCKMR